MAGVIFALCALTAFACSWLILRGYFKNRHRILLWSGLCFAGMAVNNLFLIIGRAAFPGMDMATWRLAFALIALLPLLYGLIWEDE